jgi:hypothetical protein
MAAGHVHEDHDRDRYKSRDPADDGRTHRSRIITPAGAAGDLPWKALITLSPRRLTLGA